jgi:hypothetical protein
MYPYFAFADWQVLGTREKISLGSHQFCLSQEAKLKMSPHLADSLGKISFFLTNHLSRRGLETTHKRPTAPA